jgi:hypothetical protein
VNLRRREYVRSKGKRREKQIEVKANSAVLLEPALAAELPS